MRAKLTWPLVALYGFPYGACVTSGEKVKFPDGHEEKHKTVKTSNPAEIENLVHWILSLPGGTKY